MTVYNLPTMTVSVITSHKRLLLLLGLASLSGILFVLTGPEVIFMVVVLGSLYAGIRLVTGPLPRFIARIRLSIRWKILAAIAVLALVSILLAIVNIQAMDYMHEELHYIQTLPTTEIRLAVDNLEDTQHGPFFSLMPFLSMLAALLAVGLGVAVAVAVISPVRKMGQAMRNIASGDFSRPVQVDNRDELGELANRINDTTRDLATLHEATLADERARALRERITHVTLVQEEERRRISRELHDGLGPSLAAFVSRLRACQQMVRTDPLQAEREIDEVTRSLKGHIQDIRHLIHDLRPLAVDQLGLIGAVRQQVEQFSKQSGIQAFFESSGDIVLDPLTEVTVFRVVQECLSNVQKHASSTQVEVSLRGMLNGLELRVQDNGQGFEPHPVVTGTLHEGVGLLSMRERAEVVGGRLSVQSSPGRGCRILLHVPSKEAEVGVHPSSVS